LINEAFRDLTPPRHRESARSINIVTATIVAHLSLKPDFGTNQLLPETAAAKIDRLGN
jgi:hypothetical protein